METQSINTSFDESKAMDINLHQFLGELLWARFGGKLF